MFWLIITCCNLHCVTILGFNLNSKNHVKWIGPVFLQQLSAFLFSLCYFFSPCNQISQNLARAKISVLCSLTFYLLKCSGYRVIYFANIYCFTQLEMGTASTLINASGGCLASPNLLELLLSLTERVSCNFLLVCL